MRSRPWRALGDTAGRRLREALDPPGLEWPRTGLRRFSSLMEGLRDVLPFRKALPS
jgi:hypothetical protein